MCSALSLHSFFNFFLFLLFLFLFLFSFTVFQNLSVRKFLSIKKLLSFLHHLIAIALNLNLTLEAPTPQNGQTKTLMEIRNTLNSYIRFFRLKINIRSRSYLNLKPKRLGTNSVSRLISVVQKNLYIYLGMTYSFSIQFT